MRAASHRNALADAPRSRNSEVSASRNLNPGKRGVYAFTGGFAGEDGSLCFDVDVEAPSATGVHQSCIEYILAELEVSLGEGLVSVAEEAAELIRV